MSQKKKINVETLIDEIERITKKRVASEDVVSLSDYRRVKRENKSPFHILFIDDDDSFRKAMVRFLEGEGYKVTASLDGTQLGKVLGEDPIDLILLDIGLPWINGYELAEILKKNHDLKDIPLIFVSGKNSELDIARGKKLGADDYIAKPFEVKVLKEKIQNLLSE